jgi:serine/threonine protein kinase
MEYNHRHDAFPPQPTEPAPIEEPEVDRPPQSEKPADPERADRALNRSLERLLADHFTKFNEGSQAILLRSTGELPSELLEALHAGGLDINESSAAKLLKVYVGGNARREFRMQQRAHAIAAAAGGGAAKIPKPYFARELTVGPETAEQMNRQGCLLSEGGKAEVILMDYVEGDDLATALFKETIRRHPKTRHLAEHAGELTFSELMTQTGDALGFAVPGGKGSTETEREFERRRVFAENTKKLYAFLERDGFVLDARVLEQMKRTIDALHANGVVLRDAHHRNFIVSGDINANGATPPEVAIVDFGVAKEFAGDYGPEAYRDDADERVAYLDDEAVIRELTALTMPLAERRQAESRAAIQDIDRLRQRILKAKGSPPCQVIEAIGAQIEDGTLNLERTYQAFPGSGGAKTDQFLAVLMELTERHEAAKPQISDFLEQLAKRLTPADRNKIVRFLQAI